MKQSADPLDGAFSSWFALQTVPITFYRIKESPGGSFYDIIRPVRKPQKNGFRTGLLTVYSGGIMILETKRLILREMTMEDITEISAILKDEKTMYAYEHGFSDQEVSDWIKRQLDRYEKYGFGLWAVILKANGRLIGQCGITMQDAGDREVMEVGYLFNRSFWHNGYACEAARACRNYAFERLGAEEICSIIRTNNLPSQRVAIRNGMLPRSIFTKHYMGIDMPHIVFSVTRKDLQQER